MDFTYNENQQMIADMIRKFGKSDITPHCRNWDENQIFPRFQAIRDHSMSEYQTSAYF